MCGLTGFIGGPTWREGATRAALLAMLEPIATRGPDGEGLFIDDEATCAMGHRRLAIIDATHRGAQPLASRCGRYVIVFNGEVYNAGDLARGLSETDRAHCGQSDTAILLAAIARLGLDETLRSLHAMFALALWDREIRRMTLARDGAGIKPLFFTQIGGAFAFGSTTSALKAWPGFDATLDRAHLAQYARYGYWPGARSIFAHARKLLPGEVVEVDASLNLTSRHPRDLNADIIAERRTGAGRTFADWVGVTDATLDETMTRELISDRPVGVFLSGGIDSSVIAAKMARVSATRVKSFAVGFEDAAFDESAHAAGVAGALGLDHATLVVTPALALQALERLGEAFDEPLSDMAAVPTWLLARLARERVDVVQTGDGGDEAFGGYDRYRRLQDAVALAARVPRWARGLARTAKSPAMVALGARFAVGLGRASSRESAEARLSRVADAIADPTRARLYRSLMTLWPDPARLVGAREPEDDALRVADETAEGVLDFAQRVDGSSYLPEALFVKTDRATMAHGLEARVPLAARDVVRVALAQPEAIRVQGGRSKAVLRAIAERHLDRTLIDRPKQGFSVPMAAWLRGPLRDWADGLIGRPALLSAGLFDPDLVGARWQAHREGKADFSYSLWAILMAQDFARRQRATKP